MEEEIKTVAEVKDKLAALKGWGGILPGKFVFVTPQVYKDAYPDDRSKWPKFKFKPYDGLDFNEDIDNTDIYQVVEGKPKIQTGKYRIHAMKQSLKDWADYTDAEGNPIPCPKDESRDISDEAIRSLPSSMQNWIMQMIGNLDGVSKEESDGLKF